MVGIAVKAVPPATVHLPDTGREPTAVPLRGARSVVPR